MKIKDYCLKTGRFFYYPDDQNRLWCIRYDQYRESKHWTLLLDNQRVGDFTWEELLNEIKHLPEIEQYIRS